MASQSLITINKDNWSVILELQKGFFGQKLFHPFSTTRVKEFMHIHKGKRTYKKEIDQLVYTDEFVDEEAEKIIMDEDSVFQIKHDGSCGFIMYDEETDTYIPYTRFDVRLDKETNEWKDIGEKWIPCEGEPDKTIATHWPHFRNCEEDPSNYKYRLDAFSKLDTSKLPKTSFTCEYMGGKLGTPEQFDPIGAPCKIVPHGSATMKVSKEFRSLSGLGELFEMFPFIEGFIVTNPKSDKRYKIRRDLVMVKHNDQDKTFRLYWPPKFIDHSIENPMISSQCSL